MTVVSLDSYPEASKHAAPRPRQDTFAKKEKINQNDHMERIERKGDKRSVRQDSLLHISRACHRAIHSAVLRRSDESEGVDLCSANPCRPEKPIDRTTPGDWSGDRVIRQPANHRPE